MGLRVCVVASHAGRDRDAVRLEPMPAAVAERSVALPPGRGPLFFWRLHRSVAQAVRHVDARVYHASDLFVLPALAAAARSRQRRLAYDARELYPHSFGTVGKPWASWTWRQVEGHYARRADQVFTVNASIARWMAASYGIMEPTILHNVPDAPPPLGNSDVLRRRTGLADGVPIALYQGALLPHRGLPTLVDAVARVDELALVLMGSGPLRLTLERQIDRLGLAGRAFLIDPVPPGALLETTASATIGVVTLDDACLSYRYALPNKLFEYLQAGLPVVASDLPELRAVVAPHQVGLLTPPGDAAAIAHALSRLARDAALRARLAANAPSVFETYAPSAAFDRLCSAYTSLLSL